MTTTDEAGKDVITAYDDLGRKTKVTEDAGGIGRVTEFAYDRAGRLLTLSAFTDSPSTGRQDTVYTYNGRGLQTIVTYEETGDVIMTYDDVGNMVTREDEAGVVVVYAYDAANRLTDRRKSGATTEIETYDCDALGRLITAAKGTSGNSDADSQSVFAYDALSRVVSEDQAIGEDAAKPVTYTYDKASNRVSMRYHTVATTAAYAYDSRDRCTGIDVYDVANTEWDDLADYTWLGNAISKRETTCDYPGGTKPKFKTDFQRDGILRVTKVASTHLTEDMATAGYNDLGAFDYAYDTSSNVSSAVQAGAMTHLDADRTYDYDSLNRLLTARLSDTQSFMTSSRERTSSYQYDDLGNRISHTYRDAAAIAAVGTGINYGVKELTGKSVTDRIGEWWWRRYGARPVGLGSGYTPY